MRFDIMCYVLIVQAIFEPPTPIRGGIPVLFPQVCALIRMFFFTLSLNGMICFC